MEILGKKVMSQPPFGLDEAFWFGEESWKTKDTQDGLDDVFLKSNVEVHSNDLSSFQDDESLFDNVWMDTKFDFSSVCFQSDNEHSSSNLVTNNSEPPGDNVVQTIVESGSSLGSITSQDAVSPSWTGSNKSISEDCPTSPEQYVPNIEMGATQNLEIDDIIAWVELHGKLPMNESEIHSVAVAMEDNPTIIEAGKKMIAVTPQPISTGKTKTPEQKQRKKLQNRNAATRYRCKKRSAQDALNSQCAELEDENKKLSKKVESLQQETEYLKKLIIEIFEKKSEHKNEQKKVKLEL